MDNDNQTDHVATLNLLKVQLPLSGPGSGPGWTGAAAEGGGDIKRSEHEIDRRRHAVD